MMDYTNGIVHLMRGDSYCKPVFINVGTKLCPKQYQLKDTDTLYFGLMEPNQSFEDAVVKKRYTYESDTDDKGNILIEIEPEDTLNLPVGKYFYMVKLRTSNEFGKEIVKTIIAPTQFFIDGNNKENIKNVSPSGKSYDIDHIIVEGGEVAGNNIDTQHIIFDGGEIL